MKLSQSGLTIVEVLITLVIIGAVMSVGLPSMTSFVESAQVESDSNALFNSLQRARSESATRNSRVSLCKIDQAAPTTCDNSQAWHSGWIVFEDSDTNGVRGAGEAIFSTSLGMRPNTIVTTADYGTTISFLPSGGVSNNGSLNICVNGNVSRSIIINATGRPRIAEAVCP